MTEEGDEPLRELCEKVSQERDLQNLLKLVAEIERLLDKEDSQRSVRFKPE